MDFVIEKSVEMPVRKGGRGAPTIYPFGDMDVGDSVVVEGSSASGNESNAYSSAKAHGKRYGKKFSGRKEPGMPGFIRIWRIE